MRGFVALLSLAATVSATFSNNLNYRSPSHNHPALGISIHKVAKRNIEGRAIDASKLNFTHNVASGDPLPTSVILWTRCSPMLDDDHSNVTVSGYVPLYNHDTSEYIALSHSPVCVAWTVATDQKFRKVVASGSALTSSDIDYTVKVEATGLEPFTTYYYRFNACGTKKFSPIGRTKTAPTANQVLPKPVGLAVYSCSNYPFGYFNAFGNPARKDSVDYVIHLGDYIYEYKEGDYGYGWSIERVPLPDKTIVSLYDYRKRYATYRNDFDLALSHQQFAWIPVWDDHEVADNTYRDGMADLNNTEASFVSDGGIEVDQRKMNAVRAYFEWMPIRQVDMDDNLRIWRSFSIGNLFDLIMLDTRQYDRSITDLYWNTDYIHAISNDASRSMMGSLQENWFYNQLVKSNKRGAVWRIIGSQTVFSRMNESFAYGNVDPLDYDAWDGYQANRNRTFNVLYENNIGNNIVISGDSHLNWASDLVWLDKEPYNANTGAGSVGVEFAGTAVSSPSPYGHNITLDHANEDSQWLVKYNRELQWQEAYYRGYFELHIDYDQVVANYFGMPTIVSRNPYEISLANFTVKAGANALERPIGGAVVENGALKVGSMQQTNLTNDTSVPGGRWFISHYDLEDV